MPSFRTTTSGSSTRASPLAFIWCVVWGCEDCRAELMSRCEQVKTGQGGSWETDDHEQSTLDFAAGIRGSPSFGIWSVRFSNDGSEVVAGANDGQIFVYGKSPSPRPLRSLLTNSFRHRKQPHDPPRQCPQGEQPSLLAFLLPMLTLHPRTTSMLSPSPTLPRPTSSFPAPTTRSSKSGTVARCRANERAEHS